MLVIVMRSQVNNCVYETKHKALGGLVDDDVNDHVVLVMDGFVSLGPIWPLNPRSLRDPDFCKTRETEAGEAPENPHYW